MTTELSRYTTHLRSILGFFSMQISRDTALTMVVQHPLGFIKTWLTNRYLDQGIDKHSPGAVMAYYAAPLEDFWTNPLVIVRAAPRVSHRIESLWKLQS